MSIDFYIEDIKYKGTLTIRQILEIGKTISQFDISYDDKDLDIYLSHRMRDYQSILLGQDGLSARGFDFSYKDRKKSYCVKVPIPCSTNDFTVAFSFIKKLCAYLENNKILIKKGEEYLAENIEEYPYESQNMSALKKTMRAFKKQTEPDTIEFSGIHREVSFNEKMFSEIMESGSPIEKFSDFCTKIQNIKAVTPRQRIQRGTFIGVYTLTETVWTILPFKPIVAPEYEHMLSDDEIESWSLNLVVIEGDPADIKSYRVLGSIKYTDFIERLPKDKYRFIDADYILVEGLNRQEIENLLRN